MKRPAKCSLRNQAEGLLLVEAVLSAVVIAVGLVAISRGLSNQLQAIRRVEEQETLLVLAHDKLAELEAERLFHHPGPPDATGVYAAPYGAYRWTIAASVRDDARDAAGDSLMSEVTLTVRRDVERSASVRLVALWPKDWVPPQWF